MAGPRRQGRLSPSGTRTGPKSDSSSKCREGLAHLRELLDAYDQVNADFETVDYGDPDAMDALLKNNPIADAIDAADAWELDRHIEIAMDAAVYQTQMQL